jgi:glycine/D-amino acid oxidase-like deaminating enzyme
MRAQNPLWEATAEPAPALTPLEGAAEAEVAIVGAGFSGLSTALALAERGVAVTLLEAEAPGAGGERIERSRRVAPPDAQNLDGLKVGNDRPRLDGDDDDREKAKRQQAMRLL